MEHDPDCDGTCHIWQNDEPYVNAESLVFRPSHFNLVDEQTERRTSVQRKLHQLHLDKRTTAFCYLHTAVAISL